MTRRDSAVVTKPHAIFCWFDDLEIYDSEIVGLFEVCGKDVARLAAVMQAFKDGQIKAHEIKLAIRTGSQFEISPLAGPAQQVCQYVHTLSASVPVAQ